MTPTCLWPSPGAPHSNVFATTPGTPHGMQLPMEMRIGTHPPPGWGTLLATPPVPSARPSKQRKLSRFARQP